MTGLINYTPEAEQQLQDLEDAITKAASADTARHFVSAIMDDIDSILLFPFAGRGRDDVRPGMRTTTYRKRALVAYEVDDSSEEVVVNILGVFHGGQDWEPKLHVDPVDRAEV